VNQRAEQNGGYVDALLTSYFSDPQYRVLLKAGDVLLHQGEPNDRLYVLLSGSLRAEQQGESGYTSELFQATSHRFVGVYSFFSATYLSVMTLVAEEDCVLAYLDRNRFFDLRKQGDPLFERFMPVVVTELVNRYRQTQELTIAREKAFQKLLETEKVASLGQLAAGVAHELNNAIAVLARNSEWLSQALDDVFGCSDTLVFYQKGLREGYHLSSKDRRQQRNALEKKWKMNAQKAERIVELGLGEDALKKTDDELNAYHTAWKMGSALHDVLVASKQAAHVVRSMKVLGRASTESVAGVDVNGTLQDAMSLSKPLLDGVEVVLDLETIPLVFANAGELVQIWLNLIKNACESMVNTSHPKLSIASRCVSNVVRVSVEDCGTGISSDILPHIFQPNVTTKVDGLSFGLGLGLTIVQRLVHQLNGDIVVESCPGRTSFCVHIPIGSKS